MSIMEDVAPAESIGKTEAEEHDLVILGGGTGSTIAAWTFAEQGQRVAVIDRKYIGGSCPNIACLPSKNIIHSAKVASYFPRSEEFGIANNGFRIDMSAVRDRKRRMVSGLNETYLDNYRKTGAELIFGSGRFIGPRTVEVTLPDGKTRQLRGANVIISTGTRATLEPIPGLADAKPLTHIEALELDEVPQRLLVIGGGYVAVELSQAMRRFGSKVTVVERNDALLHREDEDVTEALSSLFHDEGINVELNARVKTVSGRSGQSVKVVIKQNGMEKTVEGTHLLVAAGRRPNTEGIGLELAGVELTDRGYVKVNKRLQTTGRQVPFCLFIDPELARVGLSEKEARAQGIAYRLFKIPMEAVLRARALSETRGFLKALVEADGDRILGFTGFGVGSGEIMSAVQIAMLAGLPCAALREAILTHPTLVEGLGPLFSSSPSIRQQRLGRVA